MIDIPSVYVGRFKDNPNQSPILMKNSDMPTYTDDNWANVESTGTIWRYNAKAGEWIDTGLEEILVEEVCGTKQIVAEGTVPWKLQGLKVYGKSTQQTTTGRNLFPMEEDSYSADGLTATKQSDGSYLVKGIPTNTYATVYYNDSVILEPGEYYIFSDVSIAVLYAQVAITRDGETFKYVNKSFTIDGSESSITVSIQTSESMEPLDNVIIKPMLNAGSIALPWEPYTGGQPSPNPDYPQEIVNAGQDGQIDVTVCGANIFDVNSTITGYYASDGSFISSNVNRQSTKNIPTRGQKAVTFSNLPVNVKVIAVQFDDKNTFVYREGNLTDGKILLSIEREILQTEKYFRFENSLCMLLFRSTKMTTQWFHRAT